MGTQFPKLCLLLSEGCCPLFWNNNPRLVVLHSCLISCVPLYSATEIILNLYVAFAKLKFITQITSTYIYSSLELYFLKCKQLVSSNLIFIIFLFAAFCIWSLSGFNSCYSNGSCCYIIITGHGNRGTFYDTLMVFPPLYWQSFRLNFPSENNFD